MTNTRMTMGIATATVALICAVSWGGIAIERYQAGVEHADLIERTIEQQLIDSGVRDS